MKPYDHRKIEKKWQEEWQRAGVYKTSEDPAKKKCYVLDMFPYPSGEGLHVGHPKGYIGTDIYARYKKMNGYNVLHPMGWDAFGLPAENYALKHKIHPRVAVEKNIARFKKQLEKIGFSYDWEREINTTDPAYYKWTQWIFLEMFKRGLAYESNEPINWCPSCKTGLALEDLEGGKCERCGSDVEQKPLRQWVLKIREYADRLLADLDALDWSESVKEAQRNWIGRSHGAEIEFPLVASPRNDTNIKTNRHESIRVFTTRPDTLFGATYLVLSPEHPLIQNSPHQNKFGTGQAKFKIQNSDEVQAYIESAKRKTDLERTAHEKEKTGVELKGIKAVNPATKEEIPIWIADYVLAHYGTGAIMAVPAHDERDFAFAKKFGLPVRQVIWKQDAPIKSYLMGGENISDDDLKKLNIKIIEKKDDGDRLLVIPRESLGSYEKLISNKLTAGFWNEYVGNETVFLFKNKDGHVERIELNPETEHHIDKLAAQFMDETWKKTSVWKWLAENKFYTDMIIHADTGIMMNSGEFNGMASEEAKWKITEKFGERRVDYKLRDWVFSRQRYWGEPIPIIHCAKCGAVPVPEEDLPVLLPEVEHYEPTGTGESPLANISEWVNVKCPKCGGAGKRETNTMPQWAGSSWYYLAYVMRGIFNFQFPISKYKEAFEKWLPVDLYVGGVEHATRHLIYARFWHKFLFDIGVVAHPEPFLRLKNQGLIIGADGRKMSKRWGNVVNPDDVIANVGADTLRVYEMFMGPFEDSIAWSTDSIVGPRRFLEKVWRLREKVSSFKFQVSSLKIERLLHKTIKKVSDDIEALKFNTAISALMIFVNELEKEETVSLSTFHFLLLLLHPFAPHITEELWRETGGEGFLYEIAWPRHERSKIEDEEMTIVVQVNGRVRGSFRAPVGLPEDEIKNRARALPEAQKWTGEVPPEKIIYVTGKLVNIVTKK